jgi:hypothetical protein
VRRRSARTRRPSRPAHEDVASRRQDVRERRSAHGQRLRPHCACRQLRVLSTPSPRPIPRAARSRNPGTTRSNSRRSDPAGSARVLYPVALIGHGRPASRDGILSRGERRLGASACSAGREASELEDALHPRGITSRESAPAGRPGSGAVGMPPRYGYERAGLAPPSSFERGRLAVCREHGIDLGISTRGDREAARWSDKTSATARSHRRGARARSPTYSLSTDRRRLASLWVRRRRVDDTVAVANL